VFKGLNGVMSRGL